MEDISPCEKSFPFEKKNPILHLFRNWNFHLKSVSKANFQADAHPFFLDSKDCGTHSSTVAVGFPASLPYISPQERAPESPVLILNPSKAVCAAAGPKRLLHHAKWLCTKYTDILSTSLIQYFLYLTPSHTLLLFPYLTSRTQGPC